MIEYVSVKDYNPLDLLDSGHGGIVAVFAPPDVVDQEGAQMLPAVHGSEKIFTFPVKEDYGKAAERIRLFRRGIQEAGDRRMLIYAAGGHNGSPASAIEAASHWADVNLWRFEDDGTVQFFVTGRAVVDHTVELLRPST